MLKKKEFFFLSSEFWIDWVRRGFPVWRGPSQALNMWSESVRADLNRMY